MGRGIDHESVRAFREFASRYSRALRMRDNAMATGDRDRHNSALACMQAVENEFGSCFVLTKRPDWNAVVKSALGETV